MISFSQNGVNEYWVIYHGVVLSERRPVLHRVSRSFLLPLSN